MTISRVAAEVVAHTVGSGDLPELAVSEAVVGAAQRDAITALALGTGR